MMVRSIGYALSWEYWRRGIYWFVPACAILVIAFMAPVYAVLSIRADVRVELDQAVFSVVCWASLVMALASRSFLRRQYTLPVSTASLVGCTLANGSLAVALTYWLVALGFNALFHADWPFWGPAWWAVVVYVAFQAAVWSVAGGRGGLLIFVVFLVWIAGFVGPFHLYQRLAPTASDNSTAPVWPTISAADLAVSLAVVVACCLAAVYVVGRDRRGDNWSFDWLSPAWWAQRIGDSTSAPTAAFGQFTPRTFRSPRAAQFWMEWRSKGRYVSLAAMGAVGVLWVVAVLNRFDWYSVSATIDGFTATFFVMSPFVGVYLGHRSERFDMKPFLATRPLADGEQALVVLRHVAAACSAGALIWFIGVAVTNTLSGHPLPSLLARDGAGLAHGVALVGFLLLVWTLVALGAALGMARSWFVPVGGLGGGVLLMILINIAGQSGPLPAAAATFLLTAGSAGGTAAAFVAARRRRLVSRATMLGALTVYVVLVVACFLIFHSEGVLPLDGLLRITGLCAAPLAPLAVAPLALAWNRHR